VMAADERSVQRVKIIRKRVGDRRRVRMERDANE